MPNWISNVLSVSADTSEELILFLDKHLVGSWFKLDTIVPQPKSRDECPMEYIVNSEVEAERLREDPPLSYPDDKVWFDWYNWNMDNWGCKWEASGFNPIDKKMIGLENICSVNIVFTTAWRPPLKAINVLFDLHPNLRIGLEYYSFESYLIGCCDEGGTNEMSYF